MSNAWIDYRYGRCGGRVEALAVAFDFWEWVLDRSILLTSPCWASIVVRAAESFDAIPGSPSSVLAGERTRTRALYWNPWGGES